MRPQQMAAEKIDPEIRQRLQSLHFNEAAADHCGKPVFPHPAEQSDDSVPVPLAQIAEENAAPAT
jgi:hypothetical protein